MTQKYFALFRSSLTVFVLFMFFGPANLFAQERSKVQFGKISPADFTLPASPVIDSNANAVIIFNEGSTHFVGNDKGWFSYVFKKEERLKIINKKAFGAADITIHLYVKDEDVEKLENVSATTYNLENGKISETRLDKKDIFDDRKDKNHIIKKFTLPAVKEGSLIEFSYTITSPYTFNLPYWEFQSENYPCLWSEYEVVIPQTLSYVFVKHGVHKLDLDKGSEGHETYRITEKPPSGELVNVEKTYSVSATTIKHSWAMKDIPAFQMENYISSPENYLDQITFQLSQIYDGSDTRQVMDTWKQTTEELLKEEKFGLPLSEDNDWLNDLLDKIGANISDPLDLAKAIYYYERSNFTCTDHYNKYIKTNLRDVVKKRSGTVGDINLLLIAMLRKKGITADPVLLSTREHGFNFPNYPMMERLNYVIARVSIGGNVYYLDAAHPQLGFGQLPGNCYNGHARIISARDSGSIYFYADSLKEKKMTMVLLSNNEKGEIEGSYQTTLGPQESYYTREQLGTTKEKEFFKNIQTSYGEDLDISNPGIDSLDKPEMPVHIHYEFRLKQNAGTPMIYFNPLFAEAYRHNPFGSAERKYPVEMPYSFDNVYVFNMEVPPGYAVEELPKSAKVAFNGNEGLFEYLMASDADNIQLRVRVKLNRCYFAPEDYGNLRDFFAYIVKKESEQIVLKKK